MGLFGFLGESRNNRKTARYQSNSNDSSPTSNRSGDYGANVVGVDKYNVWQLISKLRDFNKNYKYK